MLFGCSVIGPSRPIRKSWMSEVDVASWNTVLAVLASFVESPIQGVPLKNGVRRSFGSRIGPFDFPGPQQNRVLSRICG